MSLRDVASIYVTAHMPCNSSPHNEATARRVFFSEEWCRVRPENRRAYLRTCVDALFEDLINLLEPETENERANETARIAELEAAREQAYIDSIWDIPGIHSPTFQRVGVDRTRGGGEDRSLCQEWNGEDNARVDGAEPDLHRSR